MNEPRSSPKILIVDDKPQNLLALQKLLRKLEVEVVQATSGSEALALTLEHDFCLAIVDVQMPEMDGYELVELLRGNPSTASLPVIFISGIHSDEYHHRKGYDAGAVDFLSKPFVPETLLSKVRVFLDLYRQRIKLQELINELNTKNEALAQVTGELQEANTALSKRAKQLEASNQVGQQATSVLELDELLAAVVESIHSRFGYYFVGVWLLNEARDRVVLQAGIGRDGRQALEPGWSIGLDTVQSIIAWVARSGAACLAGDVGTDARYLALDALPATRSEVALPLRVGQEIIGVLDIQSDRLAGFDDEDQRVLQTLANQIAIAIENARLYEQAQREIAERRRVEEALRESEQRYRTLINLAPDMIYLLDPDGKIMFVSSGVEPLGYVPDELVGRRFEEIVHPDDIEKVGVRFVERRIGERATRDLEIRLLTKHGEVRDHAARCVEVTISARGLWDVPDDEINRPQKTFLGTLGIARDITERKRAEEALREYSERLEEMVEERTQELREAQEQLIRQEKLAVLGKMAGGVGHELRNPLAAISNAAYFLNMVIEEPDPEIKETLEILEKEAKTAENIISSLLDFARIKLPTWQKVDINGVIQEVLSRATVPENVEVVSRLDGRLPIILADPGQLVQVFGNIILNGIQAMPEGGRLVIESEVPSPEWVIICVSDTGVGISEENLGKLFEPLFTTKAKGIGLGLSVTKTLVEGHGGSIGVRSEVGKGSTFTVKLPTTVRKEKT